MELSIINAGLSNRPENVKKSCLKQNKNCCHTNLKYISSAFVNINGISEILTTNYQK